MDFQRILVVANNHPNFHSGGTEVVAHGMFRHWRLTEGRQAYFLAAALRHQRQVNPGTTLQSISGVEGEFLQRVGDYDMFHHLQRDKIAVFTEITELLGALRPEVVLLHHYLGFGTEILPLIRRLLPDATLVLALHDYHHACHHDGMMVKTNSYRLCHEPTMDACHQCFPKIPASAFKLREMNIKHHFATVDHLVAPSKTMRDRLVAWGLEAEKVTVIRNGTELASPAPARPLRDGARRARFAVLGNVSPAKGQKIVLQAVRHLVDSGDLPDLDVAIHGAPIFQTDAFKAEIDSLLDACRGHARLLGGYERHELPDRLASADWVVMPSIWWENAPLVLDEAFHHGRPPVCSAVGGMKESVRDRVDGLHFSVGNSLDLAETMREAIEKPELWEQLRGNAPKSRDLGQCADDYIRLFGELRLKAKSRKARTPAVFPRANSMTTV